MMLPLRLRCYCHSNISSQGTYITSNLCLWQSGPLSKYMTATSFPIPRLAYKGYLGLHRWQYYYPSSSIGSIPFGVTDLESRSSPSAIPLTTSASGLASVSNESCRFNVVPCSSASIFACAFATCSSIRVLCSGKRRYGR
jgi:hypothetical protein